MSNHRMFSKRITGSARFLQMPHEAQNLYFHLGLNADDDGVVESYPVTKLLGTAPDVMKVLLGKQFLIPLNDDQVVFIRDWQEHNKIRADRKIDSIYKPLLDAQNIDILPAKARSDVKDNSKRLGGQSTDGVSQVKLSKDKLINTSATADLFNKFWSIYPKKEKKKEALELWKKKKLDSKAKPILSFLEKAKETDRWKSGFIKQPTAFLRGECWEDDLSAYNDIKEKFGERINI